MKELEIIKANVEVIKVKLLIFLAVASGSWVYAYKSDGLLSVLLSVSFAINAFGVFTNLVN